MDRLKRTDGIGEPPKQWMLSELNAEIGTEKWFTVLTKSLGTAVKEACDAGMPVRLAEEVYTQALKDALPQAVRVTGPRIGGA